MRGGMRVLLVLCLTVLAACAPRGTMSLVPAAAEVGQVRSVYVGTTRKVDDATNAYGFGRSRDGTAFGRYDISVPPDRAPGKITWPRRGVPPDPRTDFLATGALHFDGARDFRADLGRALRQRPPGHRDVTVFVHGFNTTFAEGVYRIAQMSHDLSLPGEVVHYAWPSRANPLGYVYDRDSALFGRDGMEALLNEAAAAGAERILLVAHSMGSALTMETLRQVAIRGDRRLLSRLSGVVLISPDIDIDVFHAQASAVGRLPQPFIIFTSRRDRALALSARLTGQRDRLGNLGDVAEVGDLAVTVVDVAAFNVGAGHFNVVNSPPLIALLKQIGEVDAALAAEQAGRTGLLPGVVLTVQNATQIVLSPVAAVAGAPQGRLFGGGR